jgi:methionine synthase II (cobalamin-independent)
VMWGAVPASGAAMDETVPGLAGRLRHHLGRLERAGLDPDRVTRGSLVSPSCGLALLPEQVADRVLELSGRMAAALQAGER